MELVPIKELLKRRRKLMKELKPIPVDDMWTAEMEALGKEAVEREIAAIDAEIAERMGNTPPRGNG